MTRRVIYWTLIFIGIINALTIIASAMTGPNAYTIANSLVDYFELILCFIPLTLTGISIIWWLVDLVIKAEKRVNYIAIAFSGVLADAVFVIGTLLFASGH